MLFLHIKLNSQFYKSSKLHHFLLSLFKLSRHSYCGSSIVITVRELTRNEAKQEEMSATQNKPLVVVKRAWDDDAPKQELVDYLTIPA